MTCELRVRFTFCRPVSRFSLSRILQHLATRGKCCLPPSYPAFGRWSGSKPVAVPSGTSAELFPE